MGVIYLVTIPLGGGRTHLVWGLAYLLLALDLVWLAVRRRRIRGDAVSGQCRWHRLAAGRATGVMSMLFQATPRSRLKQRMTGLGHDEIQGIM